MDKRFKQSLTKDSQQNPDNKNQSHPKDAWLWPTILFPLAVHIACSTYGSYHPDPGDFSILSTQFLFILFWVLFIFFRCLRASKNSLRKRIMSYALSITCLIFTVVLLPNLDIGDYFHLAIEYPKYQSRIHDLQETRQFFDWGKVIGSFGYTYLDIRTLVYDPLDKLPMENQAKNKTLKNKFFYDRKGRRYQFNALSTKPLLGHFYLVNELRDANN